MEQCSGNFHDCTNITLDRSSLQNTERYMYAYVDVPAPEDKTKDDRKLTKTDEARRSPLEDMCPVGRYSGNWN